MKKKPVRKLNSSKYDLREVVQSYLMILPMLVGFSIFALYPIIWLIRWAWFEYDGFSYIEYVGFDNFIRAFTRDPEYWMSLLNTFLITITKLSIEIPLALILAYLLHRKIKGSTIFRVGFFLPSVLSYAIIGLIFFMMFSAFNGIVNEYLVYFNIIQRPIDWFGSKWTALIVIMIASIFRGFGINMIYFLMGLQNIPEELYECARIDGAGEATIFFKITLPLLAPIIQIVTLLAILGTMKMTDLVLVLTNGQPGGKTEVVMTYIFKFFFSYGRLETASQYGYASSLAVITAIILGIFTFIYLKFTDRIRK